MSGQKVVEALKRCSAYDLAQMQVNGIDFFAEQVLSVSKLGVLAVRIYVYMFLNCGAFSTVDVAAGIAGFRPNVYRALVKLEGAGYVRRLSRNMWQMKKEA